MLFFDWTYIIVLPAMLLALYAQHKVNSSFSKYSRTNNRRGLTGADVAQMLLTNAGVHNVRVEMSRGHLTDHYDPRSKTLRLSESVYGSRSLSAVGVAAHETGHALQDEHGYVPLGIRNSIVPVANIGSKISWPIIIIGLILTQFNSGMSWLLVDIGILLFTFVVIFQLITLPVEFNASARAIDLLQTENILTSDEIIPAKKVLNAAALTYVAAAASAILSLIRLLLIANRRR